MVLNAPGRMEAISDFLSFVGDQVLVGHNIHSFDLGFVERAARENLGRELFNDYVDTLPLARSFPITDWWMFRLISTLKRKEPTGR